MAKKRLGEITEDLSKMDRAAGVAAERLSAELDACHEAIQACLKTAADEGPEGEFEIRKEMFETAGKLMMASAGLASALARLKGEFHQRITVNHGAPARVVRGEDSDPWPHNVPKGRDYSASNPRDAEEGGG